MDKDRGINKYYNKRIEKTSRIAKREEKEFFCEERGRKKIDIHKNIIKIGKENVQNLLNLKNIEIIVVLIKVKHPIVVFVGLKFVIEYTSPMKSKRK